MDIKVIISQLKQQGNLFEVYQKTSFKCYRKDSNDNSQEVDVDILDAGPDEPKLRYRCIAKSEDGKMATGNPESTIDLALLHVHWNNLD